MGFDEFKIQMEGWSNGLKLAKDLIKMNLDICEDEAELRRAFGITLEIIEENIENHKKRIAEKDDKTQQKEEQNGN